MSGSSCPRCDRAKREWADLCWRCWTDDRIADAEARGYAAGMLAVLDPTRIRQLLQLCHPDKHSGSAAATDATRWLLEQRRVLTTGVSA
jgi:hypothetical protein